MPPARASRVEEDAPAVQAKAVNETSLLKNSGHWFHSMRRSTAELLNAQLHRAIQLVIAACYGTNYRNS